MKVVLADYEHGAGVLNFELQRATEAGLELLKCLLVEAKLLSATPSISATSKNVF